ncbi:MAG: hypothetical protein ACI8QZ_004038 [Chlamydiales bacterium]|jgi:hypothetical protein
MFTSDRSRRWFATLLCLVVVAWFSHDSFGFGGSGTGLPPGRKAPQGPRSNGVGLETTQPPPPGDDEGTP